MGEARPSPFGAFSRLATSIYSQNPQKPSKCSAWNVTHLGYGAALTQKPHRRSLGGGIPQSWGHPVRPHPKSSPGLAGGPRLHPTRYAMGEYWGGGHGDGTAPLLPRDPPPIAGGSQGGTPSTGGLIPTPHSPPRGGSPTPNPPRCHGGGSPRTQINSHRDNREHPPRP